MSTETKMVRHEETKTPHLTKPYNLLSRWEHDMERMFEDFWRRPLLGFGRPEWRLADRFTGPTSPSVDVYEEKDDVVVKAELPGLSKDEIDVNLSDSTLTLRGEKKREENIKEEEYFFNERSYGVFTRSIELPCEVKSDHAKATFKDGVLQVRIPKTEEAKRKAISVKIM